MKNIILSDLKKSFGLEVYEIVPVTGGLLNLKWRISTDQGELLVKQYSMERFNFERIEKIEAALQRQRILEQNGVNCPFLWQTKGRVIQWLDEQTAYMVMNFCAGHTENHKTITIPQMVSLGNTCASMHQAFAKLPANKSSRLPVFGGYTLDLLWDNFYSLSSEHQEELPEEYRKALMEQEAILKQLDRSFFASFPRDFAHEDFQPGNILFLEDCVSAVVDFDRNCFSYVWHDIGRAILSFAFSEDWLNEEKIQAFREGYSQYSMLTPGDIVNSLRLTWCIESPWWIQPGFFGECEETPKRFREELVWLTRNWFELEALLHL